MNAQLGRFLVIAGVVLVVFGLMVSGKLGPLGRLPGDIVISRPNFTFYFPLTTMVLLSIVLSVMVWLFRK